MSDFLGISFQHSVVQGKQKRLKYVAAPNSFLPETSYSRLFHLFSEKFALCHLKAVFLEMTSTSWCKMVMLIVVHFQFSTILVHSGIKMTLFWYFFRGYMYGFQHVGSNILRMEMRS